MKKFFYYAYDKNKKIKFGFSERDEKNEVLKEIREKKLFLVRIININIFNKQLDKKDLLDFFIKLCFFVKNKYQFYRIIEFIEEDKKYLAYSNKMKKSINNGEKLTEIFKNSGLPLKDMDFMILKVAEKTGNIYYSFKGIETRLREELEREKQIRKILIYPKIVSCIIIVLLFFLGKFILPNFIEIIGRENITLVTKIIIFFSENILFIFIGTIIFIVLFKFLLKNKTIKDNFFVFLIKIGFIRNIVEDNFISYFSKMINIFLEAGITFSESIEIIIKSISNEFFISKLEKTRDLLVKGNEINKAVDAMKIFQKGEIELIKTGEEIGELSKMFDLISLRRKERLIERSEKYIKLLEPLTIILIGIIVVLIFIGVYTPILNMMDNI
ncbi:type II secretion system F family protein [Fusobacterium sp.]|uniref:type II secretion system F family protein n=1 Tax=Fusobacterium sp. TaxID=68766 RepID=UPI00260412BD|nr:type II secretion system F family protein [Fusobacterium sp.]